MPDKIHYQIFDSLGRVERVLVNHDAKDSTGKVQQDNGGKNVQGIDQVLKYEYNVKGELISEFKDNNVDGIYEVRESKVLNANGKVVETQLDYTNDGKVDKVTENTLNAKGEVIKSEYYNQAGDGTKTYTGKDEYTLDSNGYQIAKSKYAASGVLLSTETYKNDTNGKILEKRVDTNADGLVDKTYVYNLDPTNGQVSRKTVYSGDYKEGISLAEKYTVYGRNELGYVTSIKQYTGDNQTPDKTTIITPDIYGNQIHMDEYNAAGVLVASYEQKFDSKNQMTDYYRDMRPIGTYSSGDVYAHYEFNEQGQYIKQERTYNYKAENPVVDDTSWFEYDNFGRVYKIFQDYDRDGEVSSQKDSIVTNKYNDLGRRVAQIFEGGDGTPKETYYEDYDIDGVSLYSYRDVLSDGSINRIAFGNAFGFYGKNQTEDLRTWIQDGKFIPKNQLDIDGFSKLDFKGVTEINLSAYTNSTDITLDSKVISALAPKSALYIYGDATDTVRYKGDDLLATGKTTQSEGNTYQEYTTSIDGTAYTVLIDSDINTIIG